MAGKARSKSLSTLSMCDSRHLLLPLLLIVALFAGGQSEPEIKLPEATPPLSAQEKKREALTRILIRKAAINEEIEQARSIARNIKLTEFERGEAAGKIAALQVEFEALDAEFSRVAAGISLEDIGNTEIEPLDLNAEVKEVFRPLVQEFRDITSAPREAEDLRSEIEELKRRLAIIDDARDSLSDTFDEKNPQALKEALKRKAADLEAARQNVETELGIAEAKLTNLTEDGTTFVRSVSTMVQDFFRSRGLHLLMAALGSAFVVLMIRFVYKLIMKLSPKNVNQAKNFTGRLINLAYILISVIGGILAFILVLYLANDWLLLAIALLFLFGVAWAGKHTLPRFVEQSKMMLNLGSVRQGERIIYEGIPWEVQKINFYTSLVNKSLEGGLIRLPMRDLMPLHSRPNGARELWFPCQEDDWVILSDGTFGKVIHQTPDYVHIVKLGGSRKVIPTADFLELHPENISKNFRITVTFGIDYKHQDIAVSRVPAILEASIQRAFLEKIDKEQLFSLKVFFTSAAASSLDYRIVADFGGELAPRMNALRDLVQATCVETCNKNNWVIPFTQITVHQAESPQEEDLQKKPTAPHLP